MYRGDKMTRNDALEALDRLHNRFRIMYGTPTWQDAVDIQAIRQALTAQPSPDVECVQKMHELESPDVEAIKRECEQYIKDLFNPTDIHEQDRILGAMAAIDYLASKGHLKNTVDEKGVDLDALKRECVTELGAVCHPDNVIDHLASTGRISEWRPISEAPNDGVSFLVWAKHMTDNEFSVIQASWFEGRLYADSKESIIDFEDGLQATHWMPLPAAPKEKV